MHPDCFITNQSSSALLKEKLYRENDVSSFVVRTQTPELLAHLMQAALEGCGDILHI